MNAIKSYLSDLLWLQLVLVPSLVFWFGVPVGIALFARMKKPVSGIGGTPAP